MINLMLHLTPHSEAYKILGIFPSHFKSHFITGSSLMKGLAAAGHEVTVISPFKQSKAIQNWRDVPVQGIVEMMNGTIYFVI